MRFSGQCKQNIPRLAPSQRVSTLILTQFFGTVCCTDRLDRKWRSDEKNAIAFHTFRSCVHLYQWVSERQADASFVRSYILLILKVSAHFPSSFPHSWVFP